MIHLNQERIEMKLIFSILLLGLCIDSKADLKELFENQTEIKQPFELRDPFQVPKFKSAEKVKREKNASGKFEENVQKLEKEVDINKIEIVGVLIGKDRRVMIKDGGKVYTLKEGEPLGTNGPEIKAILAGGIILVEQIVNIYEEPEYIETIIPISR